MIHSSSTKRLYEKIEEARLAFKNAKNREERIALSNYMFNLYNSIELISFDRKEFNSRNIFGRDKDFKVFNKKLDYYYEKREKKFATDQEFHRDMFLSIIDKIGKELKKYAFGEYVGFTDLTEDDFYGIFYEFMGSLGLNRCFDRFKKEGRIYTTNAREDETDLLGYTAIHPITRECNIFVNDFHHDLSSMFTLAHEFGHVYDYRHFEDGVSVFNNYFYVSFYGEIVSKTFERLFLYHLIDKKVLVEEAQDSLFAMEVDNHDFLLASTVLSLLPTKSIKNGSYLNISKDELKFIVDPYFKNNKVVFKYIDDTPESEFEIANVLPYTYGDIVSLFIADSIKKYGFSEEAFRIVFENRTEVFSGETLDKYGINAEKYVKLYKKELQMMKK